MTEIILRLLLVLSLSCYWVYQCKAQTVEDLNSTDFIQDMDSFSTSGSTSVSSGKYKTGHATAGGGTYTSSEFDLQTQMSISEINSGFDLNYGVTVNSHVSNSRLGTCGSLTQRSDCRDIFKLTINLFDSNVLQQTFEHEVELDFTGNRDYAYSQTIAPNNYYSLTGEMQLYGIDAGYHSGYHGPQFSDPYLTSAWSVTHFLNEEIMNLLEHSDILDTNTDFDQVNVMVENPHGEVMDNFTIEVEHDMDMAMEMDMNMDLPMTNNMQDLPTISMDMDMPEPMEMQVEMQMETEMEMEITNNIPEPETQEEIANVEEQEMEEETTQNQEESSSNERPNEVGNDRVNEQTDEAEDSNEETSPSETRKQKVVAAAKQKVASKIVKNMGDKGRYDATNQIKTLVVMQVLGNTKTFFDTQKLIQDTENFFDSTIVPDNTISDSNYAQYLMFGGSDAAHNELINSQYE